VNILSIGYGNTPRPDENTGVIELSEANLYSGPISENTTPGERNGFLDIITIGAPPPKEVLWKSLFKKHPCGKISY
jgi:hypothetical protein